MLDFAGRRVKMLSGCGYFSTPILEMRLAVAWEALYSSLVE